MLKDKKGLTLLEVMITLSLLLMVITVSFAPFMNINSFYTNIFQVIKDEETILLFNQFILKDLEINKGNIIINNIDDFNIGTINYFIENDFITRINGNGSSVIGDGNFEVYIDNETLVLHISTETKEFEKKYRLSY